MIERENANERKAPERGFTSAELSKNMGKMMKQAYARGILSRSYRLMENVDRGVFTYPSPMSPFKFTHLVIEQITSIDDSSEPSETWTHLALTDHGALERAEPAALDIISKDGVLFVTSFGRQLDTPESQDEGKARAEQFLQFMEPRVEYLVADDTETSA